MSNPKMKKEVYEWIQLQSEMLLSHEALVAAALQIVDPAFQQDHPSDKITSITRAEVALTLIEKYPDDHSTTSIDRILKRVSREHPEETIREAAAEILET